MDTQKIMVTSYENPDLDGTSCAFAYSEFLEAQGIDAVCALFGIPHREAEYVFKSFNIIEPLDASDLITDSTQIILVDASDTSGISSKINPDQVIEIIDHRKFNQAEKFVNAKIQIELVGSAATLVAEKFMNADRDISQESATLLYSAILSNTVNFQASVTTDRDKKAAGWLLSKCKVPENFIHDMFVYKSTFKDSLKDVLTADEAEFEINGKKCLIFQLEIVEVERFIQDNITEIQAILTESLEARGFNYAMLTVIDIENATNTFIIADNNSQQLLEKAVGVTFKDKIAKRNGVMMRKTLSPLIKEVLEKI
jgi:manganese-dependent inorganic pyrophosphatase